MLVFWPQKLVILAMPKSGSTAIEASLGQLATLAISRPPELKHTPAYRYQRFLAPYLRNSSRDAETFEVFAIMREPIDWLGSWYRFRQRESVTEPGRSTLGLSFDEFVDGYMSKPRPLFADVGSQSKFLRCKDGIGVTQLFRYEEMPKFLACLEAKLGTRIELPRVNVSPEMQLELTPERAVKIRNHLREDYSIYDAIA
jgi:hypothetical protein